MAMDLFTQPARRLLQLYSNMASMPCRLCRAPCQAYALCPDCINDLPKINSACPHCALPMDKNRTCGQCLTHPPIQTQSTSAYVYSDTVRQLLIDFKFHGKLYLSDFFAEQIISSLDSKPLPEVLIPIPLHHNRLRQRGYNQSHELAKSLSKRLKIPINNNYLSRTVDTVAQASLTFKERKKNIQHAFKLDNKDVPKHIALIDDVLTSGHTANAAAKLFKRAGTNTIEVWTIARAIGHH